jgi:hypothetical protein
MSKTIYMPKSAESHKRPLLLPHALKNLGLDPNITIVFTSLFYIETWKTIKLMINGPGIRTFQPFPPNPQCCCTLEKHIRLAHSLTLGWPNPKTLPLKIHAHQLL